MLPEPTREGEPRLACYSLQLVCGAVRRFRENCFLLFEDMHGLVFRRSIHYWQDQPGNQLSFASPCPMVTSHALLTGHSFGHGKERSLRRLSINEALRLVDCSIATSFRGCSLTGSTRAAQVLSFDVHA